LRYPLTNGQTDAARCPACTGETRLILTRELIVGPEHARPEFDHVSPLLNGRRNKFEERRAITGHDHTDSIAVLLDNIRSAWNVGSIIRSADGFGFNHIFLCGITPTPEHKAVTKTSLGAEDSVPWSHHKDAIKLAKGLKKNGWSIYALEEHALAKSIRQSSEVGFSEPRVLVLGNEVTGVDPDLLQLCDAIFQIPMRGDKKSFNVASAFAVAAYQLTAKPDTDKPRRLSQNKNGR
jgi:tRNA G18 (ribose-2'-O)-methylase SpoU